ncbi:unnamed protein product [Danaus chrysippus]|uniref:(African queen) hypothetical protein n=1 Tax=Danaus chrysippus TaxID=151541 RepID=A0A8J2QX48_9NEOP|nr:unnamed protein product [Danaus chrysippus]
MASANKSRLNETKPSSPKKQGHKFVLDDYDATYKMAIQVLSGLCLKLTDEEESTTTSKIRNLGCWFLMLNIYISTVLEILGVITTASGGTIIDLFTMMPCVGYLFVGYYNKENLLNNPNQDTATNRSKMEEEELKEIVIRHISLIR